MVVVTTFNLDFYPRKEWHMDTSKIQKYNSQIYYMSIRNQTPTTQQAGITTKMKRTRY
uniref:Uncharacterized protein n=1 Tax=uncultured marine virus TaxID=186617 RepID=A0A0F7LAZ3_9VIRU|nr:hypothetical protein [uncultured marine virus]